MAGQPQLAAESRAAWSPTGLWSRLGPGIVLAMMGIGTSHLVLVPLAGAQFRFSLLWAIVLAYLTKYYVFSLPQFYTGTTGETLMEAYRRLPGPRNWAIWTVLVFSVLLVVLLAGIFGVVGTILYAAFPVLAAPVWGVISLIVSLALLWTNSFGVLENVNKLMALLFALMAVVAFVASPPSVEVLTGLIPTLPAGSTVVLASLMGLLPTGGLISLSYSEWVRLKFRGHDLREDDALDAIRARRRLLVQDFWVGHWGSMILAIIFLGLGATILYGQQELPGGISLALGLSRIFTDSLGAWVFPLFIAGMFSAIFSTGTNGMDGMARLISRAVAALSGPESMLQRSDLVYRGSLVVMALVALVVVLGFFDPVALVTLGSIIELVDVPLLLAINLYIVRRFIRRPELRLGPAAVYSAAASVVVLVGITVLTLVVRY